MQGLVPGMDGIPSDVQAEADAGRALLAEAVERTQPRLVLHGHWHQANQERISDRTEVIGLAADGAHRSKVLLTLDSVPEAKYVW